MTNVPDKPAATPPVNKVADKPAANAERAARQAAALRANLLKRKEQARRREDAKAKRPPD